MSTPQARPIEASDLDAFLKVFSEATPPSQLNRSFYAAPGCGAYLSALLEQPAFHPHEQMWTIAMEGEGLVGAAHARQTGKNFHLIQTAVRPAFQRMGLGRRLLSHGETIARGMGLRRLSLDVARENEGALRHYGRNGFVEQVQTHEFRLLEIPAEVGLEDVRLQDWPQALAAFRAFGFATFAFTLGNERHPVDMRLGEFRLGSQDPRLLRALWALDPTCAILLRTTARLETPAWEPTGTWVRMMKELI